MSNVIEFYKQDFSSTLFPLNTNLILIENHLEELNKYVYEKILNSEMTEHSFLSQQKVYATKPKNHLRRTIKLDPIAEFFIYDVIYRNRTKFRGAVSEERKCFGFKFKDGEDTFYKRYPASDIKIIKNIEKEEIDPEEKEHEKELEELEKLEELDEKTQGNDDEI